jgi:MFS family permease
MWHYRNFSILVAVALLPIMWWASIQFLFSWVWQQDYHYSSITTALHILPLLLVCFIAGPATDILQKKVPLKRVILLGQFLLIVGNILMPFADARNRYWRFVVPGMIIASSGNLFILATAKYVFLFLRQSERL